MWANFDGKPYSHAALAAHINGLDFSRWRRKDGSHGRPLFVTLHNTSVPSIELWLSWSVEKRQQYIKNVQHMYEVDDRWHGGPHYFVPPTVEPCAFGFSDPTTCGTHASCFNSDSIGIEMVGEFNREAFDSGPGAIVRDDALYLMALLHNKLGITPLPYVYGKTGLHFHRECVADHHSCPGKNVHKADVIARLTAKMAELKGAPPPAVAAEPAPAEPKPAPALPATPTVGGGLAERAAALAVTHPLMHYSWPGRGHAPLGYIKGMAAAFAELNARLLAGGDSAVDLMSSANSGNDARDAISWFNSNFHAIGMDNSRPGQDVLRHLFVLMTGLGMRESSGRYCEGHDRSAGNVGADTAEAGMFQQSWDSQGATAEIKKLLDHYSAPEADGLVGIFRDGVTPRPDDLTTYGSGTGAAFQKLAKAKPMFAVECAAVGLRVLRRHWGPVNRKELELRPEADDLFRKVQALAP